MRVLMRDEHDWASNIVPLGPVAGASVRWRVGPSDNLSVIVKAAFEMTPDGVMLTRYADPVRRQDEHALPSISVRAPRESWPLLAHPEVTLVGHAIAPTSDATHSRIRLTLCHSDGNRLLDKQLEVYGNRSRESAQPAPFKRMALSYEHALGGIGWRENPLGKGMGANQGQLPNIIDPASPDTVAGFGPVPAAFASRRSRRGKVAPKRLSGDVFDIPEDFDWTYFQSAPSDQWLDRLNGDEWVVLEGLHPTHGVLRSQLPGATAQCRVFGQQCTRVPSSIPLTPQSLHIDAASLRCTLVWRGSFPLGDDICTEALVIVVALEHPSAPVSWPSNADELQELIRQRADWLEESLDLEDEGETIHVVARHVSHEATTQHRASATVSLQSQGFVPLPAVPFDAISPRNTPQPSRGDIPGAPWALETSPPISEPAEGDMTVIANAERTKPKRPAAPPPADEPATRIAAEEQQRLRQAQADKFAREQQQAERRASSRPSDDGAQRRAAAADMHAALYAAFTRPDTEH